MSDRPDRRVLSPSSNESPAMPMEPYDGGMPLDLKDAPMNDSTPHGQSPWLHVVATPLIHALVTIAVAAGFYVYTTGMKADDTARQLSDFRSDIVAKLTEYQNDSKSRFGDISRQVSGLPDQSASLHQLDVRVTRLEAAKDARDKQVADLTNTVLQDHADLGTILSANRPKLGIR